MHELFASTTHSVPARTPTADPRMSCEHPVAVGALRSGLVKHWALQLRGITARGWSWAGIWGLAPPSWGPRPATSDQP